MRFKYFYLALSVLLILPGIFFVFLGGLKPGLDFTGGTLLEYKFRDKVEKSALDHFGVVTPLSLDTYILRTKPMESDELGLFREKVKSEFGDFEIRREESVGPVIGKELERKAILAVVVVTVAIVVYITIAFRKIPKPASSWRFGVATIAALLHDVLLVVGVFAILGYYWGVEIDSLFVTALLTIMGFSVHDTIVVFDRIRENLVKGVGRKFSDVVDISVTQTLARSLNTSLTVVLTLLALLLFGGESIRWFIVALLVGIISGTYSSIFNASVILAWWEERLGH